MKRTNRWLFNTHKNGKWQYSIKKIQRRHTMGTQTPAQAQKSAAKTPQLCAPPFTIMVHQSHLRTCWRPAAAICNHHHHHSHSRVAHMNATTAMLLQKVLGALRHSNPAGLCDALKETHTKLAIARTQRQTQRPWRSWQEEPEDQNQRKDMKNPKIMTHGTWTST